MMKSLLAAVEERWLIPTYSSRHADIWSMAHACLTLPFRVRGPVRRYRAASSARPLTLLTIGTPHRLRAFCERLAGPLHDPCAGAAQAVWRPGALESSGADVVVAEIHRWAAARFRRHGWHIVPSAVRWGGDLVHLPPALPSRSLLDDLRKVRQRAYTLERGTTRAHWDEFYSTMVVPHAERRFGDSAWIPSPRFLRTLQKTAILQFICRDGARVGGYCIVPNGGRVWLPLIGILAGNEALRREGVLAASYALGIEWAKANGYGYLDLGRTSAFVNDGIAIYKRKWGLTAVSDPLSHLFAVWAGPAGAHDLFGRNPVLAETELGLVTLDGAA